MQGTYGGGGMGGQGMGAGMMGQRSWQDVIGDWPQDSQQQVRYFADKYGDPQSVCDQSITWFNNGPWKRTSVNKMSAPHDFPQPHKDTIKQTLDYKVPTSKCSEVVEFDGSLIVDRTLGELSARCGSEQMSYLGFNLANQIVTNQTDVQGARRKAADAIDSLMRGQSPSIALSLQFDVQHGGTADVDHVMMAQAGTGTPGTGGGMGGY